jgi:predicted nucleic acid-binding protein
MKNYVFDASALIRYFQNDPGAARVEQLIKDAVTAGQTLLISAANWGEVYAVILRLRGPDAAQLLKSKLKGLSIAPLPVTPELAIAAAEIRVRHQLPLLDSFAAALAIAHHATLVTSDTDFQKIARRIPILWLQRP